MDCIYNDSLTVDSKIITIENQSVKHIKALRLRINENILITNGLGILAECSLVEIKNGSFFLNVIKFLQIENDSSSKLGLALGILDNKDRFEFALEKSIELGITEFYPIITDFTQKKNINDYRLRTKAIAAIEQSCRSLLPVISPVMSIRQLISVTKNKYSNNFLCDIEGAKPDSGNTSKSNLILVGPEGGFSTKEIELIKTDLNAKSISLGKNRLRAETAAIAACSMFLEF
jgi:16S rRNA (uracil1498-N3)-methyltransferase